MLKLNSSTLATSCAELTHWKRLWCWEGLGAGGEGDDRGWDGWMASRTRWTWVWVYSRRWWWTGRPGVLLFMGLQRVGHDWATELNWMLLNVLYSSLIYIQFFLYQSVSLGQYQDIEHFSHASSHVSLPSHHTHRPPILTSRSSHQSDFSPHKSLSSILEFHISWQVFFVFDFLHSV